VFVVGLVVFTVSSAVCGLSTTPLMLNLARAVQGTGGAMMFATALALLAQAFHGKERGTAFGVFGAVTGGAVAIGPVLGGVITSGIGWEWIFFVNVPIGVIAVFIAITRVADSRDPNATGVDWPGLTTFSGSLFLLVYALVQGNEKGWGSTEIVSFLIGAAVLMTLFIVVELRRSEPMLDLSLFRRPAFSGASIVAFCLSGSFFAMFLYLTLYLQDVLGYSPLQAGLRFLPSTLLSFIVAPIAGRLSVRVPVRLLLGSGLLLIGIGLLTMTVVDAASTWTVLIPGFVLAGTGVGLVNPPLASTAVGVVPVEHSGMASGINSTFRQVGIATGIAGLGAVFQHSVTHGTTAALVASGHAREIVSTAHGQLGTLLESGEVTRIANSLSPAARTALDHSYRVGFTGAFTTIAAIAAMVALVGAVLGFVLVRTRDFVSAGELPVAQEEPERLATAAS
jgi:EmrB/QacA subfamily drug resistance transporter